MSIGSKEEERAPKVRFAGSLEDAGQNDVVYLNSKGEVSSLARYRAAMVVYFAALIAACGALGALLVMSLGGVGLALAALMSIWVVGSVWMGFRMRTAVQLFAADRVEAARVLFEQVARSPILHRTTRARAEQGIAMCLAVSGEHATALAHSQAALARFGARPRNGQARVHRLMALHGEAMSLVNLGRTGEARAKVDAFGAEPKGNYLRLQRWTAELYLALAEGKCALEEEALYERSRAALSMTTAGALLGLSAWAYWARGDLEMSDHLLYAALDRHAGRKLSGPMPKLEEWMQGRSAELRAKSN